VLSHCGKYGTRSTQCRNEISTSLLMIWSELPPVDNVDNANFAHGRSRVIEPTFTTVAEWRKPV